MKLLTEAKDIRDELEMISSVLKEQTRLLPILKGAARSEFGVLKAKDKKAVLRSTFDAQVSDTSAILERVMRMIEQVDEVLNSVILAPVYEG